MQVGDLGYASELGNYAEYSGAPNEDEVLQYARVVLDVRDYVPPQNLCFFYLNRYTLVCIACGKKLHKFLRDLQMAEILLNIKPVTLSVGRSLGNLIGRDLIQI